jgi:hypothetical protein
MDFQVCVCGYKHKFGLAALPQDHVPLSSYSACSNRAGALGSFAAATEYAFSAGV